MKIRTTLAALALALAPGLAFAQECAEKHRASACAEGEVWDASAQICVPKPSS